MTLVERATTLSALLAATARAARGKRIGPNARAEVATFVMDAERRCLELQRILRLPAGHPEAWRPSVGRTFHIRDPKPRTITAAPFADRVVHHALVAAVEPSFERYAIADSYACRRGKGQLSALRRAQRFARAAPWVLKLDMARYFDSVDQERLMILVKRRILDEGMAELFSRVVLDGKGRGLPIGSLTSQDLANLYLGNLDHFVKDERGVRRYLRYMDDVLLFGQREELCSLYPAVEGFLRDRLGLSLNRRATRLMPVRDGVPFLGFRVYPRMIRLRPDGRRRFHRRLSSLAGLDEGERAKRLQSVVAHLVPFQTFRMRQRIQEGGLGQHGLQPGETRRFVEQRSGQRPSGRPQQERFLQPEEQSGFACCQLIPTPRFNAGAPVGVGLRIGLVRARG